MGAGSGDVERIVADRIHRRGERRHVPDGHEPPGRLDQHRHGRAAVGRDDGDAAASASTTTLPKPS